VNDKYTFCKSSGRYDTCRYFIVKMIMIAGGNHTLRKSLVWQSVVQVFETDSHASLRHFFRMTRKIVRNDKLEFGYFVEDVQNIGNAY